MAPIRVSAEPNWFYFKDTVPHIYPSNPADDGMSYSELLKYPEWRNKRRSIIERAGGQCIVCRTFEGPLHIHHLVYIQGRKPWEYSDQALICLCGECHKMQHPDGTSSNIPKHGSDWDECGIDSFIETVMTLKWNREQ